jgi:hypothetical protein
MYVGSETLYEETKNSLERMHLFETASLPRTSELGSKLDFEDAIKPAQQLIDLYKRLSASALQDFPDPILTLIRDNANSSFNIFNQILSFDPNQGNPTNARASIISSLKNSYHPTFQVLHPFISYSLHRSADFQRLDADARSVLQNIEDKSASITKKLADHEISANAILEQIRNTAAEQGVTQQAVYFSKESITHEGDAEKWRKTTINLAISLGVFAILSLFLHKIPFLKPENTYDAIQLSISKVLIFSVMAFMLFLSAKNFLNHKHNAIVNKHRQNALMTHKALVEASNETGVRDAVLIQAASCIFSPQNTGYVNTNDSDISNQKSIIEIMSKPFSQN